MNDVSSLHASFDLLLKPIDRFMHEWVSDFKQHPNTEKFQKILFLFYQSEWTEDWRLKVRREHSSHSATGTGHRSDTTRPFLTARTTKPQIQLSLFHFFSFSHFHFFKNPEPRTPARRNGWIPSHCTSTRQLLIIMRCNDHGCENENTKTSNSTSVSYLIIPQFLRSVGHDQNISVFQNWKILLSIIQ